MEPVTEHAAHNAMAEPGEIARFYDTCRVTDVGSGRVALSP